MPLPHLRSWVARHAVSRHHLLARKDESRLLTCYARSVTSLLPETILFRCLLRANTTAFCQQDQTHVTRSGDSALCSLRGSGNQPAAPELSGPGLLVLSLIHERTGKAMKLTNQAHILNT